MNRPLADKPSVLLLQAINDLRDCMSDSGYKINMQQWHEPIDGVCHVCLAGSVLAKSMGLPIDQTMPSPAPEADKLRFLDQARLGLFLSSTFYEAFPDLREVLLDKMNRILDLHGLQWDVRDPAEIIKGLTGVAKKFEEMGL